MIWIISLTVLLVLGGLAVVKLINYITSTQLKDLLDAINKEKEDVVKQRAQLSKDMFSMDMMAKQIDDTHKRVQNNIKTVKALTARINDPQWMRKFEEGRDNAPFN